MGHLTSLHETAGKGGITSRQRIAVLGEKQITPDDSSTDAGAGTESRSEVSEGLDRALAGWSPEKKDRQSGGTANPFEVLHVRQLQPNVGGRFAQRGCDSAMANQSGSVLNGVIAIGSTLDLESFNKGGKFMAAQCIHGLRASLNGPARCAVLWI